MEDTMPLRHSTTFCEILTCFLVDSLKREFLSHLTRCFNIKLQSAARFQTWRESADFLATSQ